MTPDPDSIVETTPVTSFSGLAMRGMLFTGASQGVAVLTQILSVVILSRLLAPDDFGLVAMSAPVVSFLNMLKDFGLLQAIVQKKDLTYRQMTSLFWINGAITVAIALVLIGIAPLAALFFAEPRVTALLMAMAVPLVLGGISALPQALLNRRMSFGALAIISSTQAVVVLAVAIGWALVSPSYWALLAGNVAGAATGLMMSWRVAGWRPGRPVLDPGVRSILGFGAGVTGFNLANFFSRNLDNVLIGRVWGSAPLGLYDRAYKLLLFPLQQVANPLGRVMIPILSRLQDEPERYRDAFFRVLNLMQLLLLPGIAAMTALADTAVPFLLGEQFADAAPIFAALGIAGLLQVSSNPTGWLFVSQGRGREFAIWGLISAVITSAAIVIGVWGGVVQVAIWYAASTFVKVWPLWWLVCRSGPITIPALMSRGVPTVLAGFVSLAVIALMEAYLPDEALPKLLVAAALAYLVFAMAVLPSRAGRATLRDATLIVFRRGKLV